MSRKRNELKIAYRKLKAVLDPSPKVWWWLSFCDPEKPEGSQFLGVAIVEGSNVYTASLEARSLGCNPGGEVLGLPYPEGEVPLQSYSRRLLSAQDVAAMDEELETRSRMEQLHD